MKTRYSWVGARALAQAGFLCLAALVRAPAVENDHFADAAPIVNLPYLNISSNTDATREIDEPPHHGSTNAHSVWWIWTALSNQPVQAICTGSAIRTVLAVYTGSTVGGLTGIVSGRGNHGINFIGMSGVVYRVALDSFDAGSWGGFAFRFLPGVVPPANDAFASPGSLTGAVVDTSGTNLGATGEPGEPKHAGIMGGKSVWWTWTAPATGRFQIDTTGSVTVAGASFDTLLAVYTGSSLTGLTCVASNDNCLIPAFLFNSLATVDAVSGTTYRIAVDGWEGRDGNIALHVRQIFRPSNDRLSDATVAIGHSLSFSNAANADATIEAGEPLHADQPGGHSLWWRWTAPASGTTTIDTFDSTFDTLLAVYSGATLTGLVCVASNDEYGAGSTSLVTFSATAGTTYRIAVDGWLGATGLIALHIAGQPPTGPINDYFGNATPVANASFDVTNATNVGSTLEPGEPSLSGWPGGASVWWSWVAPSSGNAVVSTSSTNLWTLLAVYTGTEVSNLTFVSGLAGLTPQILFAATSGTAYRIAVDGYLGSPGTFDLHISPGPPAPANDAFAQALVVAGTDYATNFNSLAASKEPGEPDHNGRTGGKSLWWDFTAPVSGRIQVKTTNASMGANFVVGVYTGSDVSALTGVAGGYSGRAVYFAAVSGATYRIALDDGHNMGGTGIVTLRPAPAAPANDLFLNATLVTGRVGSVTNASSIAADKESGEPLHAGAAGGKSVWWRWTAAASGTALVDTHGSDYDTLLAVYTGSVVSALTGIASNDQAGAFTNTSQCSFTAVAGVTYHIAVDGWQGDEGSVALNIAGPVLFAFGGQSMSVTGAHFRIRASGPSGSSVVFQANSDLSSTNWVPIMTSAFTDGWTLFTDPDPATNRQRFIRAVVP